MSTQEPGTRGDTDENEAVAEESAPPAPQSSVRVPLRSLYYVTTRLAGVGRRRLVARGLQARLEQRVRRATRLAPGFVHMSPLAAAYAATHTDGGAGAGAGTEMMVRGLAGVAGGDTDADTQETPSLREMEEAGDACLSRHRYLCDYIFNNVMALTEPQIKFITAYTVATLPLYYKKAIATAHARLVDEYGVREFPRMLASTMPRQSGKTTIAIVYIVVVLLSYARANVLVTSYRAANSDDTVAKVGEWLGLLVPAIRAAPGLWPAGYAAALEAYVAARGRGVSGCLWSRTTLLLPSGARVESVLHTSITGKSPNIIVYDELSLVDKAEASMRAVLPIAGNEGTVTIFTSTLRAGDNPFNKMTSVRMSDTDPRPVVPLITLNIGGCTRRACKAPGAVCTCYDHMRPQWRTASSEARIASLLSSVSATGVDTEITGRMDNIGERVFAAEDIRHAGRLFADGSSADGTVYAPLQGAHKDAGVYVRVSAEQAARMRGGADFIPRVVISAYITHVCVGVDANLGGSSDNAIVSIARLTNGLYAVIGMDAYATTSEAKRGVMLASHIHALLYLRARSIDASARIVVFIEDAVNAVSNLWPVLGCIGAKELYMGCVPGNKDGDTGSTRARVGVPTTTLHKGAMVRTMQHALAGRLLRMAPVCASATLASKPPGELERMLFAQLDAFRATPLKSGATHYSGKGSTAGNNDDLAVAAMLAMYGASLCSTPTVTCLFKKI